MYILAKGPFNNYVDKVREGGGQKMSVFVHAQGIKTVHARGGAKKGQNYIHVIVECHPMAIACVLHGFWQIHKIILQSLCVCLSVHLIFFQTLPCGLIGLLGYP